MQPLRKTSKTSHKNKELEPIQPIQMNIYEVIPIGHLLVKLQYAGQQLYL